MNYRTDLAVELDEMLTAAHRGSEGSGAGAQATGAGSGRIEGGAEADAGIGTGDAASAPARNITGYLKKQSQIDEDISVIDIEITDEAGEKAFGKPRGRYATLEVQGVIDQRDGIKERAAAALSDVIGSFVKHDYYLRALVIGLGNEKVTPDSLGPHTVDKVKITSHLFKIFECDGDWDYANVCGFNPSVTGVTGLETADLIQQVVSMARPDVVLAIDALAAKDIHRLSTTIQICDTGIMPGAGMGNHRKEISEKTVGCPVISIGVPTVIDSRTLILEAAENIEGWNGAPDSSAPEEGSGLNAQSGAPEEGSGLNAQSGAPGCPVQGSPDEGNPNSGSGVQDGRCPGGRVEQYLESRDFDMIVTSTDIDEIIKDFSDIIANAINITLHPGIYSKVK